MTSGYTAESAQLTIFEIKARLQAVLPCSFSRRVSPQAIVTET
jgi:hypothetical protein